MGRIVGGTVTFLASKRIESACGRAVIFSGLGLCGLDSTMANMLIERLVRSMYDMTHEMKIINPT